MSYPVRIIAAAGVVLAALLGVGTAASATEGSVPAEVADYAAAPDGLIAALEDFYGVGADGKGIDFDETTTVGRVDRAFGFTPDYLAGEDTDVPVLIANEWTVPVSIADKPVGVALVWINPATVRPQLADFVQDREFAGALADLPATASIVHDQPREAWLLLEETTLTPLLGSGSTTTLAAYQRTLDTDAAPVEPGINLGSALSVATIVGVALIVVLVLLLPIVWRLRKARATVPEPSDD